MKSQHVVYLYLWSGLLHLTNDRPKGMIRERFIGKGKQWDKVVGDCFPFEYLLTVHTIFNEKFLESTELKS